jgi:hypothetical protein
MPTPVVLLGASLAAAICSHAESFLFFVVKTLNRRCVSNTDKRGETKKTLPPWRHCRSLTFQLSSFQPASRQPENATWQ